MDSYATHNPKQQVNKHIVFMQLVFDCVVRILKSVETKAR